MNRTLFIYLILSIFCLFIPNTFTTTSPSEGGLRVFIEEGTWRTLFNNWQEFYDNHEYITDLGGYPPACLRIVENNIARLGERGTMTAADIPSDVTVKLYDEVGIDPYTFLDLPK